MQLFGDGGLLGNVIGGESSGGRAAGPARFQEADAPFDVDAGESFEVSAVVVNPGGRPVPQEVVVETLVGGEKVEQHALRPSDSTVAPGQSQKVTGTLKARQGDMTLRFTLVNARTGDVMDEDTVGVTVNMPQGRVTSLDAPGMVVPGEPFAATVTIENTGQVPLKARVEAQHAAPGGQVLEDADEPRQVDPGEQATVSFEFEGHEGQQTVTMTLVDRAHGRGLDALQATVEAASEAASVNLDAPSRAGPGEDLPVTVTVSNTGDVPVPVLVRVEQRTDRGVVESTTTQPTPSEVPTGSQGQAQVGFEGQTGESRVRAVAVHAETGTELGSDAARVPVRPPSGEIESLEADPSTQSPSADYVVRAEVENTGSVPIRAVVEGVQRVDGDVVEQAALTPSNQALDPGEEATMSRSFTQQDQRTEVTVTLRDQVQDMQLDQATIEVPLV